MRIIKEVISPAKAKKYLGSNIVNNRKHVEQHSDSIANDIIDGNWIVDTGDCIKFNTKGELIDGQHRLQAIIKSDTAVQLHVAYDVPEGAMPVLDTGKTRTFAHTLKMSDTPEYTRAGAIIKWVYLFDKGFPINKGTYKPTTSQLKKCFDKHPEEFIEAARRSNDIRRAGMGMSSAAGVAFYLFNRISPSLTATFFDQLVSGENLNKNSPVLTLRNKLFRVARDRVKNYEVLALYVRAWNNFVTDTPVSMLMPIGVDKKPLANYNFPIIKTPK